MNDCLESGTQLPYIKWAMSNGYGVIVANTNINTAKVGKTKKKIRVCILAVIVSYGMKDKYF